jgi:hypothetical protein
MFHNVFIWHGKLVLLEAYPFAVRFDMDARAMYFCRTGCCVVETAGIALQLRIHYAGKTRDRTSTTCT